ncbi:MAG: RHS repeat-associated core domain-containing protein [Gallionella sp.]
MNRLTQDIFTDAKNPTQPRVTSYAYGSTGNRTSKTETQGLAKTVTTYLYDADDRLTSETKTSGTISATTSYIWDANGNLTQKVEPTQTTLYTWDSNNRLIEVKRGGIAATASSVATYQYDANGNRVSKTTADGKTVAYLVDSNLPYAQVAQEKTTVGTVSDTTTYLYGIERIQMTRAGQGTYYHNDGLGSTRALTDAAGNVTDAYDYAAYGGLENHSGASANPYLYTGEYFDDAAGLQYNRARWYDANVGRFIAQDQFKGKSEDPLSLNKYIYANVDPIDNRDPSGMMTSLTELGVAENIGMAQQTGFQYVGRIVLRETGCQLIAAGAEEAVTATIYVFLDGVTGLPYVGQTVQGVDTRLNQHIEEGKRVVRQVLGRFEVVADRFNLKDKLRLAEQLVIDELGGISNLSNDVNAISKTRGRLRGAFSKLCK